MQLSTGLNLSFTPRFSAVIFCEDNQKPFKRFLLQASANHRAEARCE